MMEWEDIGIKDADDVLYVIKEKGATAYDLEKLYGSRISGLIVDALDQVLVEQRKVTHEDLDFCKCGAHHWNLGQEPPFCKECGYPYPSIYGSK